MGTCYSKNTVGTGSSQSKIPEQNHEDSKRNGKLSPLIETASIVADTVGSVRSGSSTPDIVSGLLNEKHVNPGVVPSDSGIESIDNVQEDDMENVLSVNEGGELSKRLEHLSLDSCDKEAIDNLSSASPFVPLTNGSSMSTPKKTEGSIVNSQCKTHSAQQNKSSPSMLCTKHSQFFTEKSTANSGNVTSDSHNDIDKLKLNSSKSNSTNNNTSFKFAEHSTENLNMSHNLLSSLNPHVYPASDIFNEEDTSYHAPLAAFDSIEANLNGLPSYANKKRQSLLSEILDITETLCKCDFYSSEYCNRDHSFIAEGSGNAFNSEAGASGQFDKSCEHLNHLNASTPYKGTSTSSSQKCVTPSKKGSSLSKIVSFATQEEISNNTVTVKSASNKSLLTSRASYRGRLEAGVLASPSNGHTNKTASEIILSNRGKDFHQRSASLGSVGALMSDSSSDAPGRGTEDDIASLDLDSISRATSLSYSSIRQLMESTEDLVSRKYTAQPVTIDGVECIVIPSEAYLQLQMDLATLKQQLLYLSSLIQEADDSGQN